jgi:hypothetical protein
MERWGEKDPEKEENKLGNRYGREIVISDTENGHGHVV